MSTILCITRPSHSQQRQPSVWFIDREKGGVETQVSMGAYRPYSKTLYWTCWSVATFVIFAFSRISRFCASRVFCISRILHFRFLAFSCISWIMHISRSHTVRNSHTCISRGFHISTHLAYSAFSHFSCFDMCYRSPPWDPSHSVHMSCPHPPRSIGAYLTLFHSHYIIYVLAFPLMFIYLIMCLYYITLVCLALLTRLRGLGTRLACWHVSA